jgi:hypothetical protein
MATKILSTLAEHPGKSLDELADLILELGTDKYDPNRKEAEKNFGGYDHEFHVSSVQIQNGKMFGVFGEDGAPGDAQLAERVATFHLTPLPRSSG